MSEINPDDLEIIKDILGTDDDDPIFGDRKDQTQSNICSAPNSKMTNQNSNFKGYNSKSAYSLEPKLNILSSKSSSDSNVKPPSGPLQKCTSACLGGTSIPVGMMTETSGPHACSNLYCIKCDHNVLRFPDKRWKKSTDYLFLRNNFPENVQQNLVMSAGWCAYCCQCTFCEEHDFKKLSPFSSSWVCRGHR